MRLLGKTAIVLGMAGAMALGSMTASEARNRGAAVPLARRFRGWRGDWRCGGERQRGLLLRLRCGYGYDSYAYEPAYSGYDSYAYEPAYVAPAPVYTPPSYYGPVDDYAIQATTPTTPAPAQSEAKTVRARLGVEVRD